MGKKKEDKPKKVRSLFFRDKAIVSEKKKLKALQETKLQLIKNITEIVETYHNQALGMHTNDWIDRLPLQSLQDLHQFVAGKKNDYGLTVLDLRVRLREEHNKAVDETVKVDKEIYLSEIELLLAKINCMQIKLSSDEEA